MQENSNKIVNIVSKKVFLFNVVALYMIAFDIETMSADTRTWTGVGATIFGQDLSPDYLFTVLDNNASCFTCGGNTAYCVSLRRTDGCAYCVLGNTACSTCQLIKFLLSGNAHCLATWHKAPIHPDVRHPRRFASGIQQ